MSYGIQGDITNLSDLEKLYTETKSKSGGIDVVFVNVGQGKLAPIGVIDMHKNNCTIVPLLYICNEHRQL